MTRHTLTIAITGLLGGAAAGVLAPRIYSAYASVPAGPTGQLWYAGALVQGAAPLTGSHTLHVALFADASGNTPLACTIPALGPVDLDLTAGRFRVDVSACATALQSATTAYVRVTLDPGQAGAQAFPPSGSILPQIGAVPYAIEATRATTASTSSTATTAIAATSIAAPGGGASETIVRASVAPCCATTSAACPMATPIGSACTIATQLGTRIQSVTHANTGLYTVRFAPGTFATTPTCVVTSADSIGSTSAVTSAMTRDSFDVLLFYPPNAPPVDDGFQLICIGPQGP